MKTLLAGIALLFASVSARADDAAPHSSDCHALAQSRLGLYAHADIYPLTDKQKSDALDALYTECMKPYRAFTSNSPPPKPAPAATPPIPLESKAYAPEPPPETGPHQAVAAPVSGVSMSPVTDTAAPAQSVLQAHSPFKVATPPPPEVAEKLRRASSPPRLPASPEPIAKKPVHQQAADPTGRSELETILNQ